MINRKLLDRDQVMHAIANGEFEGNVIASKSKVVLVLTQDWCPQWHDMKGWIYGVVTEEDIDVYELEYNKTDFSEDFMNFKENQWNNHSIPYLRFYRDGVLYRESNYISEEIFTDIIKNV